MSSIKGEEKTVLLKMHFSVTENPGNLERSVLTGNSDFRRVRRTAHSPCARPYPKCFLPVNFLSCPPPTEVDYLLFTGVGLGTE